MGQRAEVYPWIDSRGQDHTLLVRRATDGVEIEHTIQHDKPDLYSGNRTIKRVIIPSDPELLIAVAKVLLNIARYERESVNGGKQ